MNFIRLLLLQFCKTRRAPLVDNAKLVIHPAFRNALERVRQGGPGFHRLARYGDHGGVLTFPKNDVASGLKRRNHAT